MYDLLFFLHNFHLWSLCFFLLNGKGYTDRNSENFLTNAESLTNSEHAHLVLILLSPAVAIVTLGVGFHGHGGEEVLHGIVAKIVTDSSKFQQVPGGQNILLTMFKVTYSAFTPTLYFRIQLSWK